jgi:peptide/nickel transport system permease protein
MRWGGAWRRPTAFSWLHFASYQHQHDDFWKSMTAYIVRRLLATIPVMAVVTVFVFFLLRLAPGDPAALIAGDEATTADILAIRARLGLDRPVIEQFALYLGNILRGDLGVSIFSNLPVTTLIAQRLEPTVMLALATMTVAVTLAIPLGVLAAWRAKSLLDRIVMGFSVMGFAVPVFLAGYVLIYIFAIQLRWLPVQGYKPLAVGLWPCIQSLILPAIALGTTYMALIARITRASMLEVLSQDYIRTANSKGLTTPRVLLLHALKNASVPIVTVIGIGIALVISGVVITETVFNIPGLGRLTVDAVLKRDYPIVQGLILVFAALYVFINLMIDISYAFLDPRIRY